MEHILKQYGAIRTGTNYLRELLHANSESVRVLMHILGDKHSSPVDFRGVRMSGAGLLKTAFEFVSDATSEKSAITTDLGNALQLRCLQELSSSICDAYDCGELRFVVSVKDPYAWLVSVRKYERWADGEDIDRISKYCSQLNYLYSSWMNLCSACSEYSAVVRYEDLIADAVSEILRIGQLLKIPMRGNVVPITRRIIPAHWDDTVSSTETISRFDKTFYTQEIFVREITQRVKDAIGEAVDWRLFGKLGYFRRL